MEQDRTEDRVCVGFCGGSGKDPVVLPALTWEDFLEKVPLEAQPDGYRAGRELSRPGSSLNQRLEECMGHLPASAASDLSPGLQQGPGRGGRRMGLGWWGLKPGP